MKLMLMVAVLLSTLAATGRCQNNDDILERMQNLTRQVEELVEHNERQEARITELEGDNERLTTRVTELEANRQVGHRPTVLEAEVAAVKDDVEDLEDHRNLVNNQNLLQDQRLFRLEQISGDLDTRVDEFEAFARNVTAMEQRVAALETSRETIVFSAIMNDLDDNNVPVHSTLKFSNVVLNLGNGYDRTTGVFTVPSGGEGYYYVTTYITFNARSHVRVGIRVNDVPVCGIFEDNEEVGDQSNGSCNSLMWLSEGDEVKIVYRYGHGNTPSRPVWGEDYCGFSAFRI